MNGYHNCVQNLCLFDKLYVDLFVEIAKNALKYFTIVSKYFNYMLSLYF